MPADEERLREFVCRFCAYRYSTELGLTKHMMWHLQRDPDVYAAMLNAERERDDARRQTALLTEACLTPSGLGCRLCTATWLAGEEDHHPRCVLYQPGDPIRLASSLRASSAGDEG